jgi:hypothetical protein
MLETGSITLIVVLINTITTPLFQYLLNSKCDIIKCCCGLIDIHRVVDLDKLDNELENDKNSKLGQL